jgi:hypothetical protein
MIVRPSATALPFRKVVGTGAGPGTVRIWYSDGSDIEVGPLAPFDQSSTETTT